MDLNSLEQQLSDALATVITEEGQLEAAISAVKAVITPVATPDPVWVAVQSALVAGGWTAPVAPAPEPPTPTTEP